MSKVHFEPIPEAIPTIELDQLYSAVWIDAVIAVVIACIVLKIIKTLK